MYYIIIITMLCGFKYYVLDYVMFCYVLLYLVMFCYVVLDCLGLALFD